MRFACNKVRLPGTGQSAHAIGGSRFTRPASNSRRTLLNCGIRHVTVPIATRILIANVRHIGLSNICVINLVYFKMQV